MLCLLPGGLVAAGLLLAPVAIAQERDPAGKAAGDPAGKTAGDPAPALEQRYNGLQLGSSTASPLPKPNARDSGTKLVWTGFQTTATGSRVFFQTTSPVEFDVKPAKSSIELKLKNCRVHLRNNGRALDTRFFATPVRTVVPRQRGKDVDVRINLKETTQSVPKSEPGPEGTTFLVLDFPPGKPDEREPVTSSYGDADSRAAAESDDEGSASKAQGKTKKRHVSRGTISTISRDAPAETKSSAPAPAPTGPAPATAAPPAGSPAAPAAPAAPSTQPAPFARPPPSPPPSPP